MSEIKKNLSITISQYILIQKIGANTILGLENPDPEDLKQLMEYQQIYDLKIDLEINKHIESTISDTEDIIKEIISRNTNNLSDIPIIPNKLLTIINQVRNGIPQCDKSKLFMLECSIDKFEQLIYKHIKLKTKKQKVGRPKKQINEQNNNMEKEIKSMMKFLGLEDN